MIHTHYNGILAILIRIENAFSQGFWADDQTTYGTSCVFFGIFFFLVGRWHPHHEIIGDCIKTKVQRVFVVSNENCPFRSIPMTFSTIFLLIVCCDSLIVMLDVCNRCIIIILNCNFAPFFHRLDSSVAQCVQVCSPATNSDSKRIFRIIILNISQPTILCHVLLFRQPLGMCCVNEERRRRHVIYCYSW